MMRPSFIVLLLLCLSRFFVDKHRWTIVLGGSMYVD